ncbi:MAG: DNA repair protein RecO C-terminal domain-containing protein, partial [Oscillospiraceae bacterium]
DCCAVCGETMPAEPRLQLEEGVLVCDRCRRTGGIAARLCTASLNAMQYILGAQSSKIFSFRLSPQALERLSHAVEAFLLVQLERGFGTLDYYKRLTLNTENIDDPD